MRLIASSRIYKGISVVEFVGCLAALGGGIVLGSIYLGVDVQAMAVGLLEKADIAVPESLALQATPEAVPESADTASSTVPESETDQLATEGIADEEEQELDGAESNLQDENSPVQQPKPLSDAERVAATKACWTALSEAIKEEAAIRTKSIRDPGDWQLFDYLLHRKDSHSKAVEAIEAIELHGVDQRLIAHVQQVLAWHRSGVELFERAAQLLTDAPAGKLIGPFAQSWQSASTQHRMEEKLILNKHKAVAGYLVHSQKSVAESSD